MTDEGMEEGHGEIADGGAPGSETGPAHRLPVVETWWRAAVAVGVRGMPLLQALLVWFLVKAGFRLSLELAASASASGGSLGLYFVVSGLLGFVIQAAISVVVHRTILLGPGSLPNRWGLFYSLREARYALALLLFSTANGGLVGLVQELLSSGWNFPVGPIGLSPAILLGVAAFAYPAARLSLVFPWIALGRWRDGLRSWKQTRGNGWRLVLVLGGPILLLWLAGVALTTVFAEIGTPFFPVIQILVLAPLSVWSTAVLSTAWWQLVRWSPAAPFPRAE